MNAAGHGAADDGADFQGWATSLRARIEQAMDQRLPDAARTPQRLHAAMRYASLGGGKRVRALLVHAAGSATGARDDGLDAPACAVELIHAYSLVHDDMPAMDDDDLRRGKPTCHKAYDEATALLVGDALQTLAFQVIADEAALPVARRLEMVRALADASGSLGMAGGQAIDLGAVGQDLDLEHLQAMHRMKTGALIRASVRLGALAAADSVDADLDALERFADCIGLAFQIQDDILDVEGSTEVLGKQQGADAALDKPTYPSLLGLEASKARAADLHDAAIEALQRFGAGARRLEEIARFIIVRAN